MATTEAERTPVQDLVARVSSDEFLRQVQVALPDNVQPKRFVRAALTALRQNPEIAGADQQSVFTALLRAAQDGLMPDGRQAALLIFYDKKEQKEVAQYVPMIIGLRMVASKYGFTLNAHPVYAKDTFSYSLGAEPAVLHEPPPLGEDRGAIIGAYATAKVPDTGELMVDVMSKAEIDKVRGVSRSQGGPWATWYEEMARKTVAKSLFKQLPLNELDEISERIVVQADADVELESVEEAEQRSLAAATDLPPVDVAALPISEGAASHNDDEAAGPEPSSAEPSLLSALEAIRLAELEAVVVTDTESSHCGKTLKEIGDSPRGKSWLKWCASNDKPESAEAAAYLAVIE